MNEYIYENRLALMTIKPGLFLGSAHGKGLGLALGRETVALRYGRIEGIRISGRRRLVLFLY